MAITGGKLSAAAAERTCVEVWRRVFKCNPDKVNKQHCHTDRIQEPKYILCGWMTIQPQISKIKNFLAPVFTCFSGVLSRFIMIYHYFIFIENIKIALLLCLGPAASLKQNRLACRFITSCKPGNLCEPTCPGWLQWVPIETCRTSGYLFFSSPTVE